MALGRHDDRVPLDGIRKCEIGFGANATEAQALADGCWPLPELALNMNTKEVGNLGLSPAEEDALVVFMMTLSDGFTP